MDAKLALHRRWINVIPLSDRPILVDQKLRYQEHGNTVNTRWRILEPREYKVNRIPGHRVITPGNENLVAEQSEPITFAHRFGRQCSKIGTRMRLRQDHPS